MLNNAHDLTKYFSNYQYNADIAFKIRKFKGAQNKYSTKSKLYLVFNLIFAINQE